MRFFFKKHLLSAFVTLTTLLFIRLAKPNSNEIYFGRKTNSLLREEDK